MRLRKKIAIIASTVVGVFVAYILIQALIYSSYLNRDESIIDLIKNCNYEINQTTLDRPISDIILNCKPN